MVGHIEHSADLTWINMIGNIKKFSLPDAKLNQKVGKLRTSVYGAYRCDIARASLVLQLRRKGLHLFQLLQEAQA